MADEIDIAAAISEAAQKPKTVSVQGMGSSEEQSIGDLVKAAKARPAAAVRSKVGGGIRFARGVNGGAV
jgi:hypothetical protein